MTQVAITTRNLQRRREKKNQLILQCTTTLGDDLGGREPLNIAVIGPPGCGKSSFLNTIFASFKKSKVACWREIAKMGDYGERDYQETLCLKIYPKQAYIENNHYNVLMPTFLDIPGLENEETEINKEVLSIFFNGKLEEGEDLSSIRQFYFNNGLHELRQLYNKRPVKARVDRIIVVCTANPVSPLPVNLLTAIRFTAKKGSREIPIYGVLTHADTHGLNYRQLNERQTLFRTHLGLIDTRFKCIANYCQDVDPNGSYISTTLPELDIPVLELMTQVLYPLHDNTQIPGETIFWIAAAITIMYLAIWLMRITL